MLFKGHRRGRFQLSEQKNVAWDVKAVCGCCFAMVMMRFSFYLTNIHPLTFNPIKSTLQPISFFYPPPPQMSPIQHLGSALRGPLLNTRTKCTRACSPRERTAPASCTPRPSLRTPAGPPTPSSPRRPERYQWSAG